MATATQQQAKSTELSILEKLDRSIANGVSVSASQGGLTFHNVGEALEFAKLMSVSQQAVPKHCRHAPGVCLGLLIQAMEWRMSPYAVASKSYVVNDVISYESQLIHAVIEQRAPIKSRLRHSYSGEGGKRRCKVWATPKGEDEALEYISPEFDKIQPKNSPLWKTKPDLQLFYNASRDWARAYFPDVIMGVYSTEELDIIPQHMERPASGMAGLKSTLLPAAGPEDNPADEQTPEREGIDEEPEAAIDQTGSGDDVTQEFPPDAQEMTAEERAEFEREQRANGRLFDASSGVGQ